MYIWKGKEEVNEKGRKQRGWEGKKEERHRGSK